MSHEEANILYKVNKAHEKVVNNKNYIRHTNLDQLDNGRVEACHMDDFYHLLRWIKVLNEAKHRDPYSLNVAIEDVIRKMTERTQIYTIHPEKKNELEELVRNQTERFLEQYDNMFLNGTMVV